MKLENRFIGVPKDRIEEPRLALHGEALARYERSQKFSKHKLPDKAPLKVQSKAIRDTIDEVKAAHAAAMNRILGRPDPGKSGSQPVIPRTVRCTLGKKAFEALEKIKTGDGELPGSIKVKLGDVKDFLVPDKSLTADANPVLHVIRQRLRNGGGDSPLRSIAADGAESTDGVEAPELGADRTDPTADADGVGTRALIRETEAVTATSARTRRARAPAISDDQLSAYVEARIAKAHELTNGSNEAKKDDGAPTLYGTLGDPHAEQKLERPSPSDATAYYDFHDLKIAWTPVWAAASGSDAQISQGPGYEMSTSYSDIPEIVTQFLPQLQGDVELWLRPTPSPWGGAGARGA